MESGEDQLPGPKFLRSFRSQPGLEGPSIGSRAKKAAAEDNNHKPLWPSSAEEELSAQSQKQPMQHGEEALSTSGPSPGIRHQLALPLLLQAAPLGAPAAVPSGAPGQTTEPHLAQVASVAQRARAGTQNRHCLQPTEGGVGRSIQSKT